MNAWPWYKRLWQTAYGCWHFSRLPWNRKHAVLLLTDTLVPIAGERDNPVVEHWTAMVAFDRDEAGFAMLTPRGEDDKAVTDSFRTWVIDNRTAQNGNHISGSFRPA